MLSDLGIGWHTLWLITPKPKGIDDFVTWVEETPPCIELLFFKMVYPFPNKVHVFLIKKEEKKEATLIQNTHS